MQQHEMRLPFGEVRGRCAYLVRRAHPRRDNQGLAGGGDGCDQRVCAFKVAVVVVTYLGNNQGWIPRSDTSLSNGDPGRTTDVHFLRGMGFSLHEHAER